VVWSASPVATTRNRYRADWGRANYARLREQGRCTRCGEKTRRKSAVCFYCNVKRKQRRTERRKAGLCRCGQAAKSGYRSCEGCLQYDRERKKSA